MISLLIENASEIDYSRIKYYIKDMFGYKGDPEKFFDEAITNATYSSKEVWEAIKRNDEIFAESSLIDSMGVSGGTLFNAMMYNCIKENISGKKMYLFSSEKDIWWDNLNRDLFKKTFENDKNTLYTQEDGVWKKAWITLN